MGNSTIRKDSYKPLSFVTKVCNQVVTLLSSYYLSYYLLFK